ncbi:MAG: phospholipase D-like domain-containing protein [Lachnospiraceae bacterium]|jgi:cardiolipin synthase|nr:phospholipase D-like domain-containing protein [Lachnospiraceae bacterium]MCI1425014.1 phospholipase D-like domain-containing protein [Lachnospiraceae bacterium]MCI1453689.1 phospholipase D-like domain-containing protein [Lachnospiraceae bacterium]
MDHNDSQHPHERMRSEKKTETRNSIIRLILVLLAIVLQVWWFYFLLEKLAGVSSYVDQMIRLLSIAFALYVYGQHTNSALKMPMIILILAYPIAGSIVFLAAGRKDSTRGARQRFQRIDNALIPRHPPKVKVLEKIRARDRGVGNIAGYLQTCCGFPVCDNSDVTYFDDPVPALKAQLEELEKAEKFIFMEYHAVEDKESFAPIHDVLKRKAAQGLDVRLFYDDIGSIGFVDKAFVKKMEADGIKTRVFNPLIPMIIAFMNNRDHRKITVIDGKVAFTGGYNLANEYFHVTSPYGFWKDTGVMIRGDAVPSFTTMFVEMWNVIHPDDEDDKYYDAFYPKVTYQARKEAGFVQPYCDSPLDDERVGENVYMDICDQAKNYCWFITPYLIITDEMSRTLTNAAKRGVDVRIITPGVPDKKLVYLTTRSYYPQLARAGVRIFEYTPGFCHAKMCVSDDVCATCGTINLDFRSLYHHFENGVFLAFDPAVLAIRNDFKTMFPQCREVTQKAKGRRSIPKRVFQCVLRLFASLE